MAAAPDGASLVEDDNEEGEQFDFDDSDDSGADTSHLTAEAPGCISRNPAGSKVQEAAAKPDAGGAAGRRLAGKHSLYHQRSSSSGVDMCVVLI